MPIEDEDDDEFDEPGEECDGEDNASVDTRPCPYCGKPVYEQAELCPHCRSYVSEEDEGKSGKSRWIVVTAVVVIAAFVLTWVFRRH